ncbi:MAG: UDP-glucose/GDP-mannose dehydrogenase family protein [Candidatus Aenigmarchaeota archaeon]|nr:UDP-glucose/GDP-mannose dehydrogenase family protein [Candidatus Aenigmarchaeota archaeon]
MKVSIIGSGYTGSLLGKGLVKAGNQVVFCDIKNEVVESLIKKGYDATLNIKRAIRDTDISFICVPTPTRNGEIDLSYVKSAVESVANEIKTKSGYHLIVLKSTAVPTTTENFMKPILENVSGKKCGEDFGLCANPEFLTQVHNTTKDPELKAWYDSNPTGIKTFEDKAVIGSYDKKSGDMLEQLFTQLNIPIFRTDIKTAEVIKYAHNLVLASRISYWNEMSLICNALGVDSKTVANIVSTDNRIGKYGTVHGKAFGGDCLPKDLEAFVNFVKKNNIDPKILEAILYTNNYFAEKYGTRE